MGFLIKLAGKELKDIEIYLKIVVENILKAIFKIIKVTHLPFHQYLFDILHK